MDERRNACCTSHAMRVKWKWRSRVQPFRCRSDRFAKCLLVNIEEEPIDRLASYHISAVLDRDSSALPHTAGWHLAGGRCEFCERLQPKPKVSPVKQNSQRISEAQPAAPTFPSQVRTGPNSMWPLRLGMSPCPMPWSASSTENVCSRLSLALSHRDIELGAPRSLTASFEQ